MVLFSIDQLASNTAYAPQVGYGLTLDIPDYITHINAAVGTADPGNPANVVEHRYEPRHEVGKRLSPWVRCHVMRHQRRHANDKSQP